MFSSLIPHSICLSSEPLLIFLSVFFNAGIAVAYFVIPFALFKYFHVGKPSTMVYLFGAFILGCGGTHVMQIVTMYFGGLDYWIEVVVCGITFIASAGTAIVLLTEGPRIQEWLRQMLGQQ
jgi:hypothetical protein